MKQFLGAVAKQMKNFSPKMRLGLAAVGTGAGAGIGAGFSPKGTKTRGALVGAGFGPIGGALHAGMSSSPKMGKRKGFAAGGWIPQKFGEAPPEALKAARKVRTMSTRLGMAVGGVTAPQVVRERAMQHGADIAREGVFGGYSNPLRFKYNDPTGEKREAAKRADETKQDTETLVRPKMQYGGSVTSEGRTTKLGPKQFMSPGARKLMAGAKNGKMSRPVMMITPKTGKGLPTMPFKDGGSAMKAMGYDSRAKMMADKNHMKRMKLATGTTLGNSGRTKKRMRLRYAQGGAVNPVGYEGMYGQKRLKSNETSNRFARFDGDGDGG